MASTETFIILCLICFLDLFYMCGYFTSMHICKPHAYLVPSELELGKVVNRYAGAGN